MKIVLSHWFAIIGTGIILLIACNAPAAAPAQPTAAPALAAAPAPSSLPAASVPAATIPLATATPSPDWMGIPERVPTTPFPTVVMPTQPASNFAFSFGYGACQITRILNTFDDTLTQQSSNTAPVSTTLVLTADERNAIYRRMRAINLFAFPTSYSIAMPDTMLRIYAAPHPRYEFTLRNNTLLKTITWEDAIARPTSDDADQLRDLIAFLKTTVEVHAELKRLPPLVEGCA
jgi:hypothetical protein